MLCRVPFCKQSLNVKTYRENLTRIQKCQLWIIKCEYISSRNVKHYSTSSTRVIHLNFVGCISCPNLRAPLTSLNAFESKLDGGIMPVFKIHVRRAAGRRYFYFHLLICVSLIIFLEVISFVQIFIRGLSSRVE